MKLKQRDGASVLIRFHQVEAIPGQKLFAAYEIGGAEAPKEPLSFDKDGNLALNMPGDAAPNKPVSIDDWKAYAADLLREIPSGIPDSNGVTECDRLAADPDDRQHNADGVSGEAMEPSRAIEACMAALEHDAGNPRLEFQLGRALTVAEAYQQAEAVLRPAATTGYAAAMAYMGDLISRRDNTSEAEEKEAIAFYQAAATAGYQPAITVLKEYEAARTAALEKQKAAFIASLPLDSFRSPVIVKAMFSGDFAPLGNQGDLKWVAFYVAKVEQVIGQYCPSAPVNDLMAGAQRRYVLEGDLTRKAFENMLRIFQNPYGLINDAAQMDAEEERANRDGSRITSLVDCSSPEMAMFLKNSAKFFNDPSGELQHSREMRAEKTPVSEPKRFEYGCCTDVLDYGEVPNLFVPEIPAESQRKPNRTIQIMMKKWGVKEAYLSGIRVEPAGHERFWLLACGYTSREGNKAKTISRRFWFAPEPGAAVRAVLEPKLKTSPDEVIGPARQSCPATAGLLQEALR
jgi:hypothetical protein